jgi:hypothetical protein
MEFRDRHRSLACVGAFALLALGSAACGGGSQAGNDAGHMGDDGGDDGGGAIDTVAVRRVPLPFAASILPADFGVPESPAVVLAGRCVADGAAGTLTCDAAGADAAGGGAAVAGYEYRLVEQRDAARTPLAVFAFGALAVGSGVQLRLTGTHAVALVAAGDITVAGEIAAVPDDASPGSGQAGGASSPAAMAPGAGPGGGGAASAEKSAGAGGGGYCAAGGDGGSPLLGPAENGGVSWGGPELVPLRGGASGGRASGPAGAGGGALALIAGGAILIEAPSVVVGGTLSANGGGGGANSAAAGAAGQSALAGTQAARGGGGSFRCAGSTGDQSGENGGGRGAADTNVAGAPGTYDCAAGAPLPDLGGGGGGGAGRIRINTAAGGPDTAAATLSPGAATECVTTGSLAAS